MYGAVPPLLETEVRVAAFPDGSVDAFLRVCDADGEPIPNDEFGERLSEGRSPTFRVVREDLEPGGQAVNAAGQAHALGDDVRLDGCLDHEVLELPFETRSHGAPSRVDVHAFADDEVEYASISDDVAGWTHEDVESVPSADAYVCCNWASVDGMTESLSALAGRFEAGEGRSDGVFVFDPGDWTTAAGDALRGCADALSALDDAVEVYLSANGRELDALADALDVAAEPEELRAAADVAGVVRHETEAAVGAAQDGRAEVPNLDVSDPVRRTGAGDRFDAGLAHGLAAGGELDQALALGNCCASRYVATGATGTAEELADLAEARHRETRSS